MPLNILQNSQINLCAAFSLIMKQPPGGLKLHEIETPLKFFAYWLLWKTYFENISKRLLPKMQTVARVCFGKALGFKYKQNKGLFYHKGFVRYISLIFPERFFWVVAFENTTGNENMFKHSYKKDARTTSVNVIWVALYISWNIFLKSVTESIFRKASGLY